MWILMIEALMAFFVLVFIVWWTMYSGRKPNPPLLKKPAEADKPDQGQPPPG